MGDLWSRKDYLFEFAATMDRVSAYDLGMGASPTTRDRSSWRRPDLPIAVVVSVGRPVAPLAGSRARPPAPRGLEVRRPDAIGEDVPRQVRPRFGHRGADTHTGLAGPDARMDPAPGQSGSHWRVRGSRRKRRI